MSENKLFLLDGMALAYRAHFAFINSHLRNAEGLPTGPIFGFAQTLDQLIEKEKPTHLAVVWDTDKPTFRHQMDADYKANRPPQPEDLTTGIPLIKEMVLSFGIPNFEKDGYEADDIIGTIAYDAAEEDVDVFMVTPDKDFMQLITDNVKMYKPLNHATGFDIIDKKGVQEYFGVNPDKVIDVLALIGDTSDNVPGVPGIGKKGAPKLINEYGSLDGAIAAASGMDSKRLREGLMKNADQARKSREMVTIHTSVPDTVSWKDLKWKGPDSDKLAAFFKRMQFRTLYQKYSHGSPPDKAEGKAEGKVDRVQYSLFEDTTARNTVNGFKRYDKDQVRYELVDSVSKLDQIIEDLLTCEVICFDTETTGKDPMISDPVGISVSGESGTAYYIPLMLPEKLPSQIVYEKVGLLLQNEKTLKIAQNYKYDYIILKRAGIEVKGPLFDTMLAAYLIDASQPLNMDALARKYLNYDPIAISELIGSGRNQKTMDEIPVEQVVPYACEDADITLRLYQVLEKFLEQDALTHVARNIEFPLAVVLAEMELRGIRVDMGMLKGYSDDLGKKMETLIQLIYEKTGAEFNLNSPQQLGDILFNKLKLPAGKKTKTGQFSTSEQVLSKLAREYEVPALVLQYRLYSKLKSTYVDALPELVNPSTGRIHTSFNQSVAATGRLSSSNPNLQNIPIRTEEGREIRRAFIADDGFEILSADYSQVELRIIAAISNDEAMKRAFTDGEDIHARTAKEVFSLSGIEEVTADLRRKAKEVNFGIPYGVSAYGLAQRLDISNQEGKDIIDSYFNRFPAIRDYISQTIIEAREKGYVKTLSGRRRYIPEINSPNANIRGFAERTAINMPIQGTAADLIKLAMIKLEYAFKAEKMKSRMLIQVHDELLFEVHNDEVEEVKTIVRNEMEHAMEIGVPLKIEMGIADNWLDAH